MSQMRRNVDRPIVCLLHGYLGVGKTTLARRLEVERWFVRFTADEWMTQLFGDDPPAENFQQSFRRVVDLQESLCRSVLRAGAPVVIDWGLWTAEQRLRMRELARECGAMSWLVSLVCDDDTALRRVTSRNDRLMGSLHISANTYEVLRERFVPLGPLEPADVVIDTAKTDLQKIDLDVVLSAGLAAK